MTIPDGGWQDVWLPVAGTLTGVDFTGPRAGGLAADLRYNTTTGTGVLPARLPAALREADEEVGLGADFVSPLGYLDPFETISAYRVLPVVALVRPGFVLRPNPDEVAEAFEAPLSLFFDHSAHRVQHIEYRGLHREIHEFEFAGHRIWGATAAMLVNLRDRLEQIR